MAGLTPEFSLSLRIGFNLSAMDEGWLTAVAPDGIARCYR
jgi:hypothetical protein